MGGVHGVGKSSTCARLASEDQAVHLEASQLIREERASAITQEEKKVADVVGNQELLIRAYRRRRSSMPSRCVLLDGHFTLWNQSQAIQTISVEVFAQLGLSELVIFLDRPDLIHERIRARDSNAIGASAISELQDAELLHARKVSSSLNLPLHELAAFDFAGLSKVVQRLGGRVKSESERGS